MAVPVVPGVGVGLLWYTTPLASSFTQFAKPQIRNIELQDCRVCLGLLNQLKVKSFQSTLRFIDLLDSEKLPLNLLCSQSMFGTGYSSEEGPEVFQSQSFRVFSDSLPPGFNAWQYVHGVLATHKPHQSPGM